MSQTLYIGIDVSKSKLDTSTTINSSNILAFSTFENNPESFLSYLFCKKVRG